jgi:hypothetical protein
MSETSKNIVNRPGPPAQFPSRPPSSPFVDRPVATNGTPTQKGA